MLYGAEHVRRYIETDGDEGYHWRRGTTTLILTTSGRKTGQPRQHALIFREEDGRYVVVASKGGAANHPEWYQNLTANPEVQVQVRGERFPARARDATPDERPRLWAMMNEVWPDYEGYQAKTSREIPVVILEPTATG
ncbi:MAG TPA: nitroreductase family deazaflavin-dependent oxidoreductase [Jiangellaceae bacterium]|nr:nitroreductase family deazaflavin-dependent oxidoreductase [Jiangellaceae bacterium]